MTKYTSTKSKKKIKPLLKLMTKTSHLRKKASKRCKKAVQIQYLRRIKLSPLLGTIVNRPKVKKQYAVAFKNLLTLRKFRLPALFRRKVSWKPRLPLRFLLGSRQPNKRAHPQSRTLRVSKAIKQFLRLRAINYRRKLIAAPRLTPAKFPPETVRKRPRRRKGKRAALRARKYRRRLRLEELRSNRSLLWRSLLSRPAGLVRQRVLPRKRLTPTKGSSSLPFASQLIAAVTKQRAKKLLGFSFLPKKAKKKLSFKKRLLAAHRKLGGRHTYALPKQKLLSGDKRLPSRGAVKVFKNRVAAAKAQQPLKSYPARRSNLQRRFFVRKVGVCSAKRNTSTFRPILTPTRRYALRRLSTIRLLQLSRRVGVVRRKRGTIRKKAAPLRLIPGARKAVIWRVKTNLTLMRNTLRSKTTKPRLNLAPPTRRHRRAAAKAARLRLNVSKGEQKRLRLGRTRLKMKPITYPAVAFALKTGAIIRWKQRPTYKSRYRTHKKISAVTARLLTLSRLNARYRSGVQAPRTRISLGANSKQAALRYLLAAAERHLLLVQADKKKRRLLGQFTRAISSVFRTKKFIRAAEIVALFRFLINQLPESAPLKKGALHFQFTRWLSVLNRNTLPAPKTTPYRRFLRKLRLGHVRKGGLNFKAATKLFYTQPPGKQSRKPKTHGILRALADKLHRLDRARYRLHSSLNFKTPRPIAPLPLSASVPQPTWVKNVVTPLVATKPTRITFSGAVNAAPRAEVSALQRPNKKKYHLLGLTRFYLRSPLNRYGAPKRRSIFAKPIWHRRERRHARYKAAIRKSSRIRGRKTAILRYLRYTFSKRNRIYVIRYNKVRRVAAKRLLKRRRWSRATVLRLRRRRPFRGWKRRRPQLMASTGRLITKLPFVLPPRGWRNRHVRKKIRTTRETRFEQFQDIFRHVNSVLPATLPSVQSGVPVRILQLASSIHKRSSALPTPTETAWGGVAVAAFHRTQQQLRKLRPVRAASTATKFRRLFRENLLDYQIRNGKIYAEGNYGWKPVKAPRRGVREISQSPSYPQHFPFNQEKNFAQPEGNNVLTSSSSPLLRKQLWTAVNRHSTSRRAKVKKQAVAQKAPAVFFPGRDLLGKKLRKLLLLKNLVKRNRFNKLSALGKLNVLEEHAYLANLNKLFALGAFTSHLKQELLLRLTTEIKFCTLAYAQSRPRLAAAYRTTVHTAPRMLFQYKKRPVSFGRDENFFISDTPKAKILPVTLLKKHVLLKALKTAPANRIARRARIIVTPFGQSHAAKRLRRGLRYRQLLQSGTPLKTQKAESTEEAQTLGDTVSTFFEDEYGELAFSKEIAPLSSSTPTRTRLHKHIKNYTKTLQPAPKFTRLRKLPAEYIRDVQPVIFNKLWTRRHNFWVQETSTVLSLNSFKKPTLLKTFSAIRPWGVKVLYPGKLETEYDRFSQDAITAATKAVNKTDLVPRAKKKSRKKRARLALLPFRLAVARAVRAYARPKVLHTTNSTLGSIFWQFHRPDKEVEEGEEETGGSAKNVSFSDHKILYVKNLKINVFDVIVQRNLNDYSNIPAAEKGGKAEYEFAKRAYKASVSALEKNPKLPLDKFETQRKLTANLLEQLAGTPLINGKALEWEHLPKNKVVRPNSNDRPTKSQSGAPTVTRSKSRPIFDEFSVIKDEATQKNLRKFSSIPKNNRQNEEAYILVKKAVLRSWTKVEEANTPKESEYYNDLLLAVKAYSFYNVTLDLTSKAATVAKLPPSFSRLPK